MKKIIVAGMLLVGMIAQTGCVSYVNHRRVANNDAEAFIRMSGDQNTINALNAGVSPVKAIQTRILTSSQGEPNGVGILFAPFELKTYIASYKENKGSYTAALVADILLGVATAVVVDKNTGGSSSSGTSSSASSSVSIKGDGNSVVVNQAPIGGNNDSSNRSDNRDQSTPIAVTPVVVTN